MRPATVRQCAVLVGGLGTRLGALTASTRKPLLPCGDRPFLAWLLREFMRYGVEEFVLLTGHLAGEVAAQVQALTALLPRPVRIVVSEEPVRAGTGGAVFHARDLLDDRFLLCNGDSLFDTNLATLLAAGTDDGPAVVGRIMLRHLDDASRYGVVVLQDGVVRAFQARPDTPGGGLVNAGIYLFDRRLFDALAPVCSLEVEILPRLARDGVLRGTVGAGYFCDIGVATDLARAGAEIPGLLHRPALFLDRDGVINIDYGWIGTRERFEWTDGAREAIRFAINVGWHVFVVTNQSGVARGHYDEAAVIALHAWMVDEVRRVGGTIDDIRYCPFHSEAVVPAYRRTSDWRKPAPGMLLDLMRAWELEPSRCVMIGDQPTDMAAADAAGVQGVLFPGGNLAECVRAVLQRRADSGGADERG